MGLGGELEEEEEEWVKAVMSQEDNHQVTRPSIQGEEKKENTATAQRLWERQSPGESHASARTGSGNIFGKEPESEH